MQFFFYETMHRTMHYSCTHTTLGHTYWRATVTRVIRGQRVP